MLEYLALPDWKTPPTPLGAWVERLSELGGGPVAVTREGSSVAWIELAALRLRGYVQLENGQAAAINFELHALDPNPATGVIRATAEALGWEIHADDEDDPDHDDDDDDD